MRNRHKMPTLVSMWMLDVFCCALGCVIMLWTLESLSSSEAAKSAKASNAKYTQTRAELLAMKDKLEATEKAMTAAIRDLEAALTLTTKDLDDTKKKLTLATTDLEQTKKNLARANSDHDDLTKKYTVATTDLEQMKKNLARSNADWDATKLKLATTDEDLKKIERYASSLATELQKKQKNIDSMNSQLTASTDAEASLRKLLRDKASEIEALSSLKKKADERITDIDAKFRDLTKESKDTTEALTLAKGTIKDLERKVSDANVNIIDLQGDKKKLADKFNQLKVEADNKFAGIAMTGKNVIFIVDISGSMKLVDERTPDPKKWPIVIETVAKVMKSIPDLSKFQVIIFSSSAKFLIGNTDWYDYTGEDSIKKVMNALKDTNPEGDTNLYSAFDLAFRFRPMGLDTVYLFSDGLPTSGPAGLTPQQERALNDRERVDAYSRHLRASLKSTWNMPKEDKKVRINAVGFFYESPEVGAFLWALARENDGSFVGMSRP